MDDNTITKTVSNCIRNHPAPCSNVCPFGLDVKLLIRKIRRGNFTAVYRMYREKVVFPEIVSRLCHHPCQEQCLPGASGQPINISLLEQSCVALSALRRSANYNLPPKDQKVAIVGAGLCGLSCALRLAEKNYQVTVYERNIQPGGSLAAFLPADIFLKEINTFIAQSKLNVVFERMITDLKQLRSDAVLIATGHEGDGICKRKEEVPSVSVPGIFFAGELTGAASPVEAIIEGLWAAGAMEAYLQTNIMKDSSVVKSPVKILWTDPKCSGGEKTTYTVDEAKAEAGRCLLCDCQNCLDYCMLLKKYYKFPPKLGDDILATLHPVVNFTGRVATRMINSCNLCGQCSEICPAAIDMSKLFLYARREMHRQQATPPVFHDFWLKDMRHAMDQAYLALAPEGVSKCSGIFFPGCQLGASDPSYVIRTYNYLQNHDPNTGILLSCCGIPAEWAGDERLRDEVFAKITEDLHRLGDPEIIFACPSCGKMLKKYLPQFTSKSLYPLLLENAAHEQAKKNARRQKIFNTVEVFDPCTALDDKINQDSVRKLLQMQDYTVIEPMGKEKGCCGFGGHIYPADPEHQKSVVESRIEGRDIPYVVYCSNCRDMFLEVNKTGIHILEIFFDLPPPPFICDLSARRENRMKAKRHFSGDFTDKAITDNDYRFTFSMWVIQEMKRELLLREDIILAVTRAETENRRLFNKEKQLFICYLAMDVVTVWVEYKKDGKEIEIMNVYTHRMKMEANAHAGKRWNNML